MVRCMFREPVSPKDQTCENIARKISQGCLPHNRRFVGTYLMLSNRTQRCGKQSHARQPVEIHTPISHHRIPPNLLWITGDGYERHYPDRAEERNLKDRGPKNPTRCRGTGSQYTGIIITGPAPDLEEEFSDRFDEKQATQRKKQKTVPANRHVIGDFRIVGLAESPMMFPVPVTIAIKVGQRQGSKHPAPESIRGPTWPERVIVRRLVH